MTPTPPDPGPHASLERMNRFQEAEARRIFERLLGLCNDVGLISEEYDPHTGRLVGNFPQAFTHVALVNSDRGDVFHCCSTWSMRRSRMSRR